MQSVLSTYGLLEETDPLLQYDWTCWSLKGMSGVQLNTYNQCSPSAH